MPGLGSEDSAGPQFVKAGEVDSGQGVEKVGLAARMLCAGAWGPVPGCGGRSRRSRYGRCAYMKRPAPNEEKTAGLGQFVSNAHDVRSVPRVGMRRATYERAVPGQERAGGDREDRAPKPPGYQRRQRREPDPWARSGPGPSTAGAAQRSRAAARAARRPWRCRGAAAPAGRTATSGSPCTPAKRSRRDGASRRNAALACSDDFSIPTPTRAILLFLQSPCRPASYATTTTRAVARRADPSRKGGGRCAAAPGDDCLAPAISPRPGPAGRRTPQP